MPKRAVVMVSMQVIHDLLQLPEAVEVLHVAATAHDLQLAVVITHPDLPDEPPYTAPCEIQPIYQRTDDGRVNLISLGDLPIDGPSTQDL